MKTSRTVTSLLLGSLLALSAPSQVASRRPLPPVGRLSAGRDMTSARAGHTATFLPDFKILIAGGRDQKGDVLATTEIYDPSTESFTPAAKMTVPRVGQIAGQLSDGKVLIAGGTTRGGVTLASSEDYDPESGKFTPRGSLHTPRARAAVTVLRDGRILVTGGLNGTQPLASAEAYEVLTGKWAPVGQMSTPRVGHTATLLSDGRVLIVGGTGLGHSALASAEIFDPRAKAHPFSPAGKPLQARCLHTSALLANGKVLIAGGAASARNAAPLASTELYDPAAHTFAESGKLGEPRIKLPDGALLRDGRVLIAGGAASAELFDPKAGTFRPVAGSTDTPRYDSAAVQLMDGSVRIFGGSDGSGASTAKSWIYRP